LAGYTQHIYECPVYYVDEQIYTDSVPQDKDLEMDRFYFRSWP